MTDRPQLERDERRSRLALRSRELWFNRRVSALPVEVLVVGAGPSGLFAAVELARHGVQARVVEREPHHHARATALQPGTL